MPSLYPLIGCLVLAAGLWWQTRANGALDAQLTQATQEATDAKAKEAAAADATRQHDKELARLRKQAAGAAKSIVATADDGCLDRGLPDSVLRALRVQPEGSAAKPAAPGGPQARP